MTTAKQMQDNGTAPPAVGSRIDRTVRPRGLDSVRLTDSDRVRDALEDMLTAAIGDHGYDLGFVEPGLALLVIEAAKRAEDQIGRAHV
mgnify:CR=1 FL=1